MNQTTKSIPFFSTCSLLATIAIPKFAFAVGAEEIQSRLTEVGNTVQTLLTGLIVIVGICVALFVIIKRMPSADDPQEKNEVYKAVGRVLGLVAIGAAIVWIVPWVYGLFQ